MNSITKKTAFGATAAAALVIAGIASPAMADDSTTTLTKGYSSVSERVTEIPIVVAPEVDALNGGIGNGLLGGGIHTGDIGSGNVVGSGNDATATILSGNETAVGNGTSVSTEVSDLVDSVTDVSGVVDVDGIVDDVTSSIDLDGMLTGILD